MRPFTIIAALVLLLIAAAQAFRAFVGLEVMVAGKEIPVMASWIASGIAALLGVMVLVESRR